MLKNPKRDPLGSLNVFLQTNNSKKSLRGYSLIEFKNFQKSHIVPKKPKGGTHWSTLYFWKH